MYGNHKYLTEPLVLLFLCMLFFPFSVPESRSTAADGTAGQRCCIRQVTDPEENGAHSFFFVEENARVSPGTARIRLQRMKSDSFRLAVLYSFSLTLSVHLFLWNRLKQRSVFGLDTCLYPPARFLLELIIRRKEDGKKKVPVPVFG